MNDFQNKYIDQLTEERKDARESKDWKLSDEIRNYLDSKLVFVFDTKSGQEIYHLTERYFKNQQRKEETKTMNKREYVEYQIKRDIKAEKDFDAWLYSMRNSKNQKIKNG